jgi:hypothetical protein
MFRSKAEDIGLNIDWDFKFLRALQIELLLERAQNPAKISNIP